MPDQQMYFYVSIGWLRVWIIAILTIFTLLILWNCWLHRRWQYEKERHQAWKDVAQNQYDEDDIRNQPRPFFAIIREGQRQQRIKDAEGSYTPEPEERW